MLIKCGAQELVYVFVIYVFHLNFFHKISKIFHKNLQKLIKHWNTINQSNKHYNKSTSQKFSGPKGTEICFYALEIKPVATIILLHLRNRTCCNSNWSAKSKRSFLRRSNFQRKTWYRFSNEANVTSIPNRPGANWLAAVVFESDDPMDIWLLVGWKLRNKYLMIRKIKKI